jgi:hypothetical protein
MQGSVTNRIMEQSRYPEPEEGMGATITMWSDRHAATIVAVRRFKTGQRAGQVKEIDVQRDKAIRTDDHGMSDAQSYRYEPDPDAGVTTFKVDKHGRFFSNGKGSRGLLIGHRDEHYDYSF